MGYQNRSLPGGYSQVSIPVFKNLTHEVGIEAAFTNSLIKQFARSKVAKVAAQSLSPVVLEGRIEKIEYKHGGQIEGKATDSSNNLPERAVLTTEYRIFITTRIVLKRLSDQKVLWQGEFFGEKVYSAPQIGLAVVNSANPLYNVSARRENITLIAQDMMAEAHDRLTENF